MQAHTLSIPDITPNTDGYGWKEVDCFLKPMSMLLESIRPGFGELALALTSFHGVYLVDGHFEATFLNTERTSFEKRSFIDADYARFFDAVLRPRFGVALEMVEEDHPGSLISQVKHDLERGRRVLIPVDLYRLPASKQYLTAHITHFVIAAGYDDPRAQLEVFDSIHVDEARANYGRTEMPYELVTAAFASYYQRFAEFNPMTRRPFFWSMRAESPSSYSVTDLVAELRTRWRAPGALEGLRFLEWEMIERALGPGLVDSEAWLYHVFTLTNPKVVLFDLLLSFLGRLGASDVDALVAERKIVSKRWTELKVQLAYHTVKSGGDYTALIAMAQRWMTLERGFFAHLAGLEEVDGRAAPGGRDGTSVGARTPSGAPAADDAGEALAPTLRAIWRDVLGVEAVKEDDDFFDIGGDSIQLARVIAETAHRLGRELPISIFFERPTVAGQAAYLQTVARTTRGRIPAAAPSEVYPASSAQRRTYVLSQLDDGTLYNMPFVLEVQGTPDMAVLEEALRALVRRHEALRTSFEVRDGEIVQRIHPEVPFAIERVRGAAGQGERIARGRIRPFDLAIAPLFRADLIEAENEPALLLLDLHHTVGDGVSIQILLHELQAVLAGRPLESLRIQYKDFATWQRSATTVEFARAQLAFWKETLAGELPALELPYDSPRTPQRSTAGAVTRVQVDPAVATRLAELARTEGVTMYVLLLACYAALLHRYTRQEDLLIGSPVTERDDVELEGVVGMFVNTLVLRLRATGAQRFRALLHDVKARCVRALEHRAVQFEDVVDALQAGGDPSRNPIFDTMFMLEQEHQADVALPGGVRLVPRPLASAVATFDLTATVTVGPSGLQLELEYAPALFSAATIERMIQHFAELLRHVAADPDESLGGLRLMSEEEHRTVVHDFNRTTAPYPSDRTIPDLFEEVARGVPDAIAIVDPGRQRITYRELDRRANRVAHRLRASGVGHETLVGLVSDRSVEQVVGMLAILKASAAYLPIDARYPVERMRTLVEDGQLKTVLVQSGVSLPADLGVELIEVAAAAAAAPSPRDAAPPTREAGPRSLAYVMYTSGSTGKPKGVMIEHRGILRTVCNSPYLAYAAGERRMGMSSPSFDVTTLDVWGPLLCGAEHHIIDDDTRSDAERLANELVERRITKLQTPTALFHHLVGQNPEIFRGLQAIYVGGEALSARHANLVRRACPEVRICNVYGPTENTTDSTYHWVDDEVTGSVPIGKPIANSTAYVVDAELRPVPIGAIGELVVGGDGLARGYWRRPELTAEKFVSSPELPSARVYRTGDHARWLPGGLLEFIGRVDEQVKIRGVRIELGEIEATLRMHPRLSHAFVTPVVKDGDKVLAAYVVPTSTKDSVSVDDVRAFVAERLFDAMVPTYFVIIDELPVTIGGKVDRRALPQISAARPARGMVPPATPNERRIAEIWREVLGTTELPGVEDNFYDLGGHSLKATLVASKVRNALGAQVSLRQLLAHPTIRRLAQLVSTSLGAGGQEAESITSCLVALKQDGTAPAVFFVPGVFGSVGYLSTLARNFPADRPLYAFQAPGVEGGEPLRSVEAQADLYWDALRACRPEGPYILAGHSFGAIVALTLARRITASGAKVRHLFLVDGFAPTRSDARPRDRSAVLSAFAEELAESLGGALQLGPAEFEHLDEEQGLQLVATLLEQAGVWHADLDIEVLRRLHGVFAANVGAEPPRSDQRVSIPTTLVRAAVTDPNRAEEGASPCHGWDVFIGQAPEVVSSPGDHYSMLRAPAVTTLVATIEARLRASAGRS